MTERLVVALLSFSLAYFSQAEIPSSTGAVDNREGEQSRKGLVQGQILKESQLFGDKALILFQQKFLLLNNQSLWAISNYPVPSNPNGFKAKPQVKITTATTSSTPTLKSLISNADKYQFDSSGLGAVLKNPDPSLPDAYLGVDAAFPADYLSNPNSKITSSQMTAVPVYFLAFVADPVQPNLVSRIKVKVGNITAAVPIDPPPPLTPPCTLTPNPGNPVSPGTSVTFSLSENSIISSASVSYKNSQGQLQNSPISVPSTQSTTDGQREIGAVSLVAPGEVGLENVQQESCSEYATGTWNVSARVVGPINDGGVTCNAPVTVRFLKPLSPSCHLTLTPNAAEPGEQSQATLTCTNPVLLATASDGSPINMNPTANPLSTYCLGKYYSNNGQSYPYFETSGTFTVTKKDTKTADQIVAMVTGIAPLAPAPVTGTLSYKPNPPSCTLTAQPAMVNNCGLGTTLSLDCSGRATRAFINNVEVTSSLVKGPDGRTRASYFYNKTTTVPEDIPALAKNDFDAPWEGTVHIDVDSTPPACRFTASYPNTGTYLRFRSVNSGLCLDNNTLIGGVQFSQQTCSTSAQFQLEPQGYMYDKHGNNGTVSCSTFCGGVQWGGDTGVCESASHAGNIVDCDEAPGLYGDGIELTCKCLNLQPTSFPSSAQTVFRIKNGDSNLCLDSSDGISNGSKIQQMACLEDDDRQLFTLKANPSNSQQNQIVSMRSDKCVDVTGVSSNPGALIQQYDCLGWGQLNQLWFLDQPALTSLKVGDTVNLTISDLSGCFDPSNIKILEQKVNLSSDGKASIPYTLTGGSPTLQGSVSLKLRPEIVGTCALSNPPGTVDQPKATLTSSAPCLEVNDTTTLKLTCSGPVTGAYIRGQKVALTPEGNNQVATLSYQQNSCTDNIFTGVCIGPGGQDSASLTIDQCSPQDLFCSISTADGDGGLVAQRPEDLILQVGFKKHGNNGTVSCDTFCNGNQWPGGTGNCLSASQNGTDVPCDSAPGGTGELTCLCANPSSVDAATLENKFISLDENGRGSLAVTCTAPDSTTTYNASASNGCKTVTCSQPIRCLTVPDSNMCKWNYRYDPSSREDFKVGPSFSNGWLDTGLDLFPDGYYTLNISGSLTGKFGPYRNRRGTLLYTTTVPTISFGGTPKDTNCRLDTNFNRGALLYKIDDGPVNLLNKSESHFQLPDGVAGGRLYLAYNNQENCGDAQITGNFTVKITGEYYAEVIKPAGGFNNLLYDIKDGPSFSKATVVVPGNSAGWIEAFPNVEPPLSGDGFVSTKVSGSIDWNGTVRGGALSAAGFACTRTASPCDCRIDANNNAARLLYKIGANGTPMDALNLKESGVTLNPGEKLYLRANIEIKSGCAPTGAFTVTTSFQPAIGLIKKTTLAGNAGNWTATSIDIDSNKLVKFNAAGNVVIQRGSSVTPNGYLCEAKKNPPTGITCGLGALLGKVGQNGTPFKIGRTFASLGSALINSAYPNDLKLYLKIDDSAPTDNTGSFSVSVSLLDPNLRFKNLNVDGGTGDSQISVYDNAGHGKTFAYLYRDKTTGDYNREQLDSYAFDDSYDVWASRTNRNYTVNGRNFQLTSSVSAAAKTIYFSIIQYDASWGGFQAGGDAWGITIKNTDTDDCEIQKIYLRDSGCFTGDTQIQMASGKSKKISEIHENEFVWNPHFQSAVRVKKIVKGPEKKSLYLVRVGEKTVTVTEDHPFLTEKGWVQTKALKKGQQLFGQGEGKQVTQVKKLNYTGPQDVYNFELDTDEPLAHVIMANGVPTGDLTTQIGIKTGTKPLP